MKKLPLRQAIIYFTIVACVIYLGYRVCFTLNLTTPYAVCVSLALYVGELLRASFCSCSSSRSGGHRNRRSNPSCPTEALTYSCRPITRTSKILRTTLRTCMDMDYPHEDLLARRRPPTRRRGPGRGAGRRLHHAPDNKHAKAGNMNAALTQTDGEFISHPRRRPRPGSQLHHPPDRLLSR